jgi:hypothetical protein
LSAQVPRDEGPRFPWFVLTGVVIGILLGTVFAWYLSPVRYSNASPAALSAEDKDHYRGMIALAYKSDGDRGRAEARLRLLADSDSVTALNESAQRYRDGAGPQEEAEAMTRLATVLGQASPTGVPEEPTGESTASSESEATETETPAAAAAAAPVDPTLTPEPTFTLVPTNAPASTAPFVLSNLTPMCEENQKPGLLQVQVEDAKGKGLAGIKVSVYWEDQGDSFYTGLAPQISPGYADFQMAPGIAYSVTISDGVPVNNLMVKACPKADGSSFLGGVRLKFKRQ